MFNKEKIQELEKRLSELEEQNKVLDKRIDNVVLVLKKSDILQNDMSYYVGNMPYVAKWDLGGIVEVNNKRKDVLFKLIDVLGYEVKVELEMIPSKFESEYVMEIVKKKKVK